MKKNLTEMVFIIDRSGSMSGLESSTINNYNEVLQKQKKECGEALITTVLFSDDYNLIHERCDLKDLKALEKADFLAFGMTALMDAVGNTIMKIQNAQRDMEDSEKPEKTVFVIITDGEENCSSEFTAAKIKKLITKKKEENGWEFMFLGANIDTMKTAESYGIDLKRAINFKADEDGLSDMYCFLANSIADFRKDD